MKTFPAFLLSALLLAAAPSDASAAAIYDFNSLAPGDLNGQDGWVTEKFNTGYDDSVVDGFGADGSRAVQFAHSGAGVGVSASRLNDASFSLPAYSSDSSHATFFFDILPAYWGTTVSLGGDIDGNGRIGRGDVGEQALRFSITGRYDTLEFTDAGGVTRTAAVSDLSPTTSWLRILIEMDLSANGGTGLGTVSWADPATGGTFQTIASMDGVGLGLDPLALDASNPDNWNGIYTHIEGATGGFDNIGGAVPEPGTLAVLGAGLLGLGATRRARRAALYRTTT